MRVVSLKEIQHQLNGDDIKDKPCVLEGNFSDYNNNEKQIKTTLFRELDYCLEHSIHH